MTAQAKTNLPRDSEILSDSEISVLDIGPSLNIRKPSRPTMAGNSPNKGIVSLNGAAFTPNQTCTLPDKNPQVSAQSTHYSSSIRKNEQVDLVDQTMGDDTPKKNKRSRSDTVRGALRTISSPLLSPLRSSTSSGKAERDGRPGVSRSKTSFRGQGGTLDRRLV
ncbi:hypothetical protein BDV25DRAFT_159845 [Aspergillus avenaceus]|uniref:Uncharacterized protein n=1 Tax=Aspergillus avenaceus TaxID=36643 RepID=A0A5N6TNI5_ASPAV|nr:hypothetical protein BDV25DRAFT_159845 [Aspergillus avenaceus]